MCQNCESKGLSRRQILHAASALLAASAIGTSSTFAAEPAGDRPNAISPSDAFDELNKGHAQYLADQPVDQKDYAVNRAANAAAQYPIASVLACADSRVPPEIVFDQGPGDLFVVRVAGNVVSTYGLASMEFSVAVLGVPLILVLGHTNCGAVAAALQSAYERSKSCPAVFPSWWRPSSLRWMRRMASIRAIFSPPPSTRMCGSA
ncbi:MAG: carbonic anhydrase [Hyphomicrobiales bacterium]